ncbi:hypothetical protein A2765_03310 [Candidatus Kaiserbacteria bacterium RIFCSPHIGHO2_01_FULL_56_24]|uniref:Protein kinase domain-containing protein n=1 Tax=Candidatus Kaiserbacteria bacterium RIFCSPHIGHO2_01_FULL_56_24 TaxID=1798487 RepID=A0A1F6DB92_9BACT|nr:MAG: hypothetical protein A2765_03310 [Candidatus Kaiserbacteria bacterium RIFCSPHIGHO2_01_FULL_56_24]
MHEVYLNWAKSEARERDTTMRMRYNSAMERTERIRKPEVAPAPDSPLIEKWRAGMKLDNTVEWARDDEDIFTGLKAGETFDGPLFIQYPNEEAHGYIGLRRKHQRTFSLPRVDAESPFHYYTMKGTGFVEDLKHKLWERMPEDLDKNYYGLYDLSSAKWDRRYSLKLMKIGVRIVEPVAILRLHELPTYAGGRVPIEELREKKPPAPGKISDSLEALRHELASQPKSNELREMFTPVVYLRKARSDTRIDDITERVNFGMNPDFKEVVKAELQNVMRDVGKELGRSLTPLEYIEWFAITCGENVGRMHRHGLLHRYLHPGNITLAAELVDFDSMTHIKDVPHDDSQATLFNFRDAKRLAHAREIERDTKGVDDDIVDGVQKICLNLAATVAECFPDALPEYAQKKDGFDQYLFEELFPYIDGSLWGAYLREQEHSRAVVKSFNMPKGDEKPKRE